MTRRRDIGTVALMVLVVAFVGVAALVGAARADAVRPLDRPTADVGTALVCDPTCREVGGR